MNDDLKTDLVRALSQVDVPRGDVATVRRGGRVRLWRYRVIAALIFGCATTAVAVAAPTVIAVISSADGTTHPISGATTEPDPSSQTNWTTYRNDNHGYTVSYPDEWKRADQTLTPHVDDPREILSVGSFPLEPGGPACANVPVNALQSLGPMDVFVSLYESSGENTTAARPEHFSIKQGYEPSDFKECLDENAAFQDRLIPFSDQERYFYVYIAIGDSASEDSRRDAFRILDSLEFDA